MFLSAQDQANHQMSANKKQRRMSKKHKMGRMGPKHAWKDPKIKLSPPPPLMGKQMGVVETPGVPPLGYELDGNVKVFKLIAQPVEQWITDGKSSHKDLIPAMQHIAGAHVMNLKQKVRGWGYNGNIPGPTIEITEGDTIRVIVKNELPEPTTIHWHGIDLPFAQDGSSDANPIMPGTTHTYEFTTYQSGTYFYHSGFNISKQEMYGLVGFLVIHPKKQEEKIDKDIAIMLQEWALLPGNIYPNLMTTDFNWFTFNGHSAPSIPILNVKQDQKVRIRLGNMVMDSHPIHVHGLRWMVTGTEGGPIQKTAQWPGSTVNVPVGGSRDVEFVAWNPGAWPFHCHKMHHVMNAHAEVPMGIMPHGGMFTFLNIIPKDPQAPWKHPSQKEPSNLNVDAFGFPKDKQKNEIAAELPDASKPMDHEMGHE